MVKRRLCSGNYAAIDIGSNAVRLLIKRIRLTENGWDGTKEQLIRVPLRLGADVFTKGRITKGRERKLCGLLRAFAELMRLYGVVDYRACATSAMRDAENGRRVIARLKRRTGIRVHTLSGREEARLVCSAHPVPVGAEGEHLLYVDVGGGSTEVNLIADSKPAFSNSYNIGTVRLLSGTVEAGERARMEDDLAGLAEAYPDVSILGFGGNINKLYRLADDKDKGRQRMTVDALRATSERIGGLTLEERVRVLKLKYDRADVIVPASRVFLDIARAVNAKYVYVPTAGLADGMIADMVGRRAAAAGSDAAGAGGQTGE